MKGPAQLMLDRGQLAPRATKVVADRIDHGPYYDPAKAGTYFVQFDGESLDIGEWIEPADPTSVLDEESVSTSTRFPSNVLKIEIRGTEQE